MSIHLYILSTHCPIFVMNCKLCYSHPHTLSLKIQLANHKLPFSISLYFKTKILYSEMHKSYVHHLMKFENCIQTSNFSFELLRAWK